jgi:hypothetical protein
MAVATRSASGTAQIRIALAGWTTHLGDLTGASFDDHVFAHAQRLLTSVWAVQAAGGRHRDGDQILVALDAAECEATPIFIAESDVDISSGTGHPLRL